MEVLITFHENLFLGIKFNSYINTAQNAKVASTRNVFDKSAMKRKTKGFHRHIRIHIRISKINLF